MTVNLDGKKYYTIRDLAEACDLNYHTVYSKVQYERKWPRPEVTIGERQNRLYYSEEVFRKIVDNYVKPERFRRKMEN